MCQVLGMMSCSPGPYGLREWAVIAVPKKQGRQVLYQVECGR